MSHVTLKQDDNKKKFSGYVTIFLKEKSVLTLRGKVPPRHQL